MAPTLARPCGLRGGGASLEFALLLPVWVTIMAGSLEASWYIYQQTSLETAVNAGCRSGATMDPGTNDWRLSQLTLRAQNKITSKLSELGGDCSNCSFVFTLDGVAPERSLICDVTWPAGSAGGAVLVYNTVSAQQVALLEFQPL